MGSKRLTRRDFSLSCFEAASGILLLEGRFRDSTERGKRLDKRLVIRQVSQLIKTAFGPNEYPGDWCLKNSTEGKEPFLVEKEFKGKTDWTKLGASFLDQAPDGFASALSFLSDEAFRFYLPAYLIADLAGKLHSTDPVFHLTHGLDDASRDRLINPRRYGCRTWFDYVSCKFAMFSREEVEAIIAYLFYQMEAEQLPLRKKAIRQALSYYWEKRRSHALPRAAL